MRELARLDDIGEVRRSDGSVLGNRRYHIAVWQRMHDAGDELIAGMRSIQGSIELEGFEGYTLVSQNAELTLVLEDGRQLPFFLSSSTGEIAARGALS